MKGASFSPFFFLFVCLFCFVLLLSVSIYMSVSPFSVCPSSDKRLLHHFEAMSVCPSTCPSVYLSAFWPSVWPSLCLCFQAIPVSDCNIFQRACLSVHFLSFCQSFCHSFVICVVCHSIPVYVRIAGRDSAAGCTLTLTTCKWSLPTGIGFCNYLLA